jgi:hypothetical protein
MLLTLVGVHVRLAEGRSLTIPDLKCNKEHPSYRVYNALRLQNAEVYFFTLWPYRPCLPI